MATSTTRGWYLLIVSMPGRQPAFRMRLWRNLKALGTAALRDGVHVLPRRSSLRSALDAQAREITDAGGSAHVLEVEDDAGGFAALFDRAAEYAVLAKSIESARRSIRRSPGDRVARSIGRLRQMYEEIAGRDFFPGPAREQVRAAIDELARSAAEILSPGEPHVAHAKVERLSIADFQGRTWATRARPWVDRLASAWLIRRYIDPAAKIRWLREPVDCPRRALGFDFDGARFTHVDGLVTFEVLAASFGLASDPGLRTLQAIVHYLDVGGVPVAEAAGVRIALEGLRRRHRGDDALLEAALEFFDTMHAGLEADPEP